MPGLLVAGTAVLGSIPSPTFRYLQLGPLRLHVFGIIVAVGIAVGAAVARRRYARMGGDPELMDRILMWSVVAGFGGARLGYVLTHTGRYTGHWVDVLAVWEGGLAFFGGLIVGTATAVVLARRWRADLPALADATAVALPLGHAIGRTADYFSVELFGTPSALPWALRIPPGARPDAYADAATFHPAFLYESLWNLATVGVLLWLERRGRVARGRLLLVYLAAYGIGRFLLEQIRTDTTFRLLGISRNGWIALTLAVAATTILFLRRRTTQPHAGPAESHQAADDAILMRS